MLTSGVCSVHAQGRQGRDMKRLVALATLSLGFAIGTTACAHQHLSRSRAKDALVGTAVFAGVIAAAMLLPCNECKNVDYGTGAASHALPPR
jgi:hypothetical protein